jgi:hypothetical protein|tara:strand:- start:2781 stop:4436 length:1656 start_codon:yes stop_codon:yes gene_type:complete
MQQALLLKAPKRERTKISAAPATKWQAASRMANALADVFVEHKRNKKEDADIAEAQSVHDAFYGVGQEAYNRLEPGALSNVFANTVADPTFSAEDRAGAGSNFIQAEELAPLAGPTKKIIKPVYLNGELVSPEETEMYNPLNQQWQSEDSFNLTNQLADAMRRETPDAVIGLTEADEVNRTRANEAARQKHLGRVEEERARMIAQNAADLPGAQAELDALNQAGEGFRPLTPEELDARNEEGLAEWEAANPTGMDAVIDLDPQSSRAKQMRNALMGEQRAIDMGVGDGTQSSMQRNVALVKGFKDAFNKAEAGLREAEDSGDEEAIALATGVYNQADSDYEVVRRLFPRDPQIARDVARATAEGRDVARASFVIMDTGQAASEALPRLRRALALLKGGEKTGGYNSWLNYAKSKLGNQDPDAGELMNLMQLDVLKMLKPTFGAAFTEKEGKLLTEIMVSFKKNVPTNIRLLENAIEASEIRYQAGLKEAEDLGRASTVSLMKAQYNMKLGDDDFTVEGTAWGEGAGDDEGAGDIDALSEDQLEQLIKEGDG